MTEIRRTLPPPEGFLSREAALFVAQMDDQSRRLAENTRGAGAAELEWQPAKGLNTIGMLLAHIAIVEVYWMDIARTGKPSEEVQPVLAIGMNDDGMPVPENGAPPATLAGKPLEFYEDLLARARAHTKSIASRLTDEDLDRVWSIQGSTGNVHHVSVRWILYHVLEHLAGHYGQINLLRHQHRLGAAIETARER